MLALDVIGFFVLLVVLEVGIAIIWVRRADRREPTAQPPRASDAATPPVHAEPIAASAFAPLASPGDATATPALVDAIDAILPQTQCTQCGFTGCRPYAEAIAAGDAEINQCPPGGAAGIDELATLLGRAPLPLNPAHGVDKPRVVAWIDEAICIGCTKCIQACPVDAIVGAARLMHTVVRDECTGCELCIAPCPVDCIHLAPVDDAVAERIEQKLPERRRAARARADHWRRRLHARQARLARDAAERDQRLAARRIASDADAVASATPTAAPTVAADAMPDAVRAAIARAQARARPATPRRDDDHDDAPP